MPVLEKQGRADPEVRGQIQVPEIFKYWSTERVNSSEGYVLPALICVYRTVVGGTGAGAVERVGNSLLSGTSRLVSRPQGGS